MPERLTPLERKLQQFAERLHRGWAKRHPVTEQQMAAVRQAVRQQWAQEQQQAHQAAQNQAATPSQKVQPAPAPKVQAKTRSRPQRRRAAQPIHRRIQRMSQ